MSLLGLADYLDRLGVMQALNLDGGSSSSFYYQGQTVYGKVDLQGNRVQRAVKSALLVQTASQ
jgi:exopolysaccharide biosynthesis protein